MSLDEPEILEEVEAGSVAGWLPGPEVVTHAGLPIDPEADFFAWPPDAIGPVLSATTTLRLGKRPMPPISRLAIAGFAGSTAVALLGLVPEPVPAALQAGAFLVLAGLVWLLTRFVHRCSYVGCDGVARFTCKGDRGRITGSELFVFLDAEALRTEQTKHYHNGVYTGTSYRFTWTDDEGAKWFVLSGTYQGKDKPPKPKDAFHFAAAAERAWTDHRLIQAGYELESRGEVRFRIGKSDWLALGRGFLAYHHKDQTERWSAAEIGDIRIDDGTLKIKRVDAREGWFRSDGVWKITYPALENALVFLTAASRWLVPTEGAPAGPAPQPDDEPVLELE